jgi:hypothetical protein
MQEKRIVHAYDMGNRKTDFSLEHIYGQIFVKTADEYFPLPDSINKDIFIGLQIRNRVNSRKIGGFIVSIQKRLDCFGTVLGLLNIFTLKDIHKLNNHWSWFFTDPGTLEEVNIQDLEKDIKKTSVDDGVCAVLIGDGEKINHAFLALVTPNGKVFRIEAPGNYRPIMVVSLEYDWLRYTHYYGNKFKAIPVGYLKEKVKKD